ncbi:MAG: PaaX family transcriptional regulator C-terminal domain-containing protein [Actinomycetota bacterium]
MAGPGRRQPVLTAPDRDGDGLDLDELLQPFSARSLVASALIGSHPPALPGRLLVALGQRFGIGTGTTRVALSRMVDRGELTNDGGTYALAGDLLARKERQDRSRRTPDRGWDGTWAQAVITATGRPPAERARLRTALGALGLGELREGVWMRPANLDPDRLPAVRATADEQVSWYRIAPLDDDRARLLASRLYDLDTWATTATALADAIGRAHRALETDDDAVVSGFRLASATLRHLIHDPDLPEALTPSDWPAAPLRQAYEDYERAYQQLLRAFFRSIG